MEAGRSKPVTVGSIGGDAAGLFGTVPTGEDEVSSFGKFAKLASSFAFGIFFPLIGDLSNKEGSRRAPAGCEVFCGSGAPVSMDFTQSVRRGCDVILSKSGGLKNSGGGPGKSAFGWLSTVCGRGPDPGAPTRRNRAAFASSIFFSARRLAGGQGFPD